MMVGINAPYYTIGYQAVRLVDGINQSYSLVNEMPTGRWYPSLVTLPDGEIAIVGGAQIVRPHCGYCPADIGSVQNRCLVLLLPLLYKVQSQQGCHQHVDV